MSDNQSASAAGGAAGASTNASSSNGSASAAADAAAAAKKPPRAQNPALKMMGLPRLRLPSRNWMIFWTITGSFAGAVFYDKWQTKRMREKWCNVVSHLADEQLPATTLPRRVTIYLAAPPGDGLRTAREHFYTYIKPILVAAAMDWDVVEGRREGDVRHKTAEKIRKRRKRDGEGETLTDEEEEAYAVENTRIKNGHVEYPGIAGDIVIGRHTWKEYIRGLHEGYLGPADPPKEPDVETPSDEVTRAHSPGHSSLGDAAVKTAASLVGSTSGDAPVPESASTSPEQDTAVTGDQANVETEAGENKDEKKEEEKPKRRFPPSYILPEDYQLATLSPSTPEIIGPSAEVRFPHLLGFRNTPTRIYRFLTRRRLADDVGRQVAAAILASHRPYSTVNAVDDDSSSDAMIDVPEQRETLKHEERDWNKSVREPRKEHEESIWIEPMAIDDRIASRMRVFQLTAEDEARAERLKAGLEKLPVRSNDES